MKNIKRVLHYYKPYLGMFTVDMCCAFIVAVCDLVYPVITQEIINEYVPNKQMNFILIGCAVVLGLYLLKMFLNFVVQYWGHLVGVK
ncbi:MAG: ABC transporter ATP-binding protein, partial [Clostridia bacterium]|nr:ABC transporter ATP-binding protein [Clostridia bacterium]